MAVRALSNVLVVALLGFGSMTLFGSVGAPTRLPAVTDMGFLVAAAIVIGCGYWGILTGRTSIDGQHTVRTWLWHKKVAICRHHPSQAGEGARLGLAGGFTVGRTNRLRSDDLPNG